MNLRIGFFSCRIEAFPAGSQNVDGSLNACHFPVEIPMHI